MFYKISKLFLKIANQFKLILIKILFFSILFFYSESAFSEVINFERNLAYKYCDSLERNLFKGLDSERILKYKYFFGSFNLKEINEEIKNLRKFPSEVENICSHKMSNGEIEDLKNELRSYSSNNYK